MDWEALLRGGGQGATMGWGDEVAAKILAEAPSPDDGTGIPREYASLDGRSSDPYEQYRNSMRGDNAAAKERAPWTYGIGEVAGAVPSAIATSPLAGGATGAARVAAGGLLGGGLGAVSGAGNNTRPESLARDAAVGAGLGGALGTAGGAAVEGLSAARGLALQRLAAEGADAASAAAQINMAKNPQSELADLAASHERGDLTPAMYERMKRNAEARLGSKTTKAKATSTPAAAEPTQQAVSSPPSLEQTADPSLIQKAYSDLRAATSRDYVSIADLQEKTSLSPEALHKWLLEGAENGTVLPRRGEWTAATPQQQAAALRLDSGPHLYVALRDGGRR